MGLDLVIRSGVRLADKVLTSLQPYVTYYAWIGQDEYGAGQYADPVTMRALVEPTAKRRRTASGQEISIKATVTFLRPISHSFNVLGAGFEPGAFENPGFEMQAVTFSTLSFSTAFQALAFEADAFEETVNGVVREDPIDPRDRIILPDGTTGPILHVTGPPVDPGTNHVYFTEVWLGA